MQAVQFEIETEQAAQGLEQGTQSPFTKNLEGSKQLKQNVVFWQLLHGQMQESQTEVVVLAKVPLGQLAEQVPL